MKYGGKVMEKLQTKSMRTFFSIVTIIGWLLLARGFIAWIPFPWAIFPILGTSIPLVLLPIAVLRKGRGSSPSLSDRIKSQRPSSGVPDLDQILDRQSGQNSPDEDETSEFFQREDMSGNMSIISDGRKRRRLK